MTGRKGGGGIFALAGLLLGLWFSALGPAVAAAQAVAGPLNDNDLQAAFTDLEALGAFFGAFAQRDTNGFARERWRRLSVNYRGTATILRALLDTGELALEDLPPGRRSALLDGGRIALDETLDGAWPGITPLAVQTAAAAGQRRDLLEPELMVALARRLASQDWPWLADHLRSVGGLAELAADPVARPLLAQFFHAKDSYLRLALLRVAEGDPSARLALARRQVAIFDDLRGLRRDMAATFGPEPAARIQDDWRRYVARVDGFAATRGWVLLDPALRRTEIGALARADADAVERAAAEVVAASPRSALAAAHLRGAGPQKLPDPAVAAGQGATSLALLAQPPDKFTPDKLTPAELAARLPLDSLALAPEDFAVSGDPAAFRAFAARLKQALAQPDPQVLVAEKEAALAAARAEVATLETRVGELDAALQTALAIERAEGAGATAPAGNLPKPQPEPQPDLQPANEVPATPAAAPPPAPAEAEAGAVADMVSALERIEHRQAYLSLFVAAVFFFVLLLWLRGRRSQEKAAPRPPLLLSSPALKEAGETARPAAAAQPVIDIEDEVEPVVPPEPEAPEAPAAPSEPEIARPGASEMVWSRPRFRVNGVTPPTREARAAMRAGVAKSDAARAAALSNEEAAAAHPMVKALREGNLPLFEMLLGEMTGLTAPRLQRIAYGGQGEDLVVVCRASGVEKLLFGSIFLLTDRLRGGDADEDPARAAEVLRMYDRLPPFVAQQLLEKWQSGGPGERPSPGGFGFA